MPFAPAFCPYTVQFPAAVSQSGTPPQIGSKIATADLLVGSARLSAFCATEDPPAGTPLSLEQSARTSRVLTLVNELGIKTDAVRDVGPSLPDCSDVAGTLTANGVPYRILARLCFRADATFIAEAVFAAKSDEPVATAFLASLKWAAPHAATP